MLEQFSKLLADAKKIKNSSDEGAWDVLTKLREVHSHLAGNQVCNELQLLERELFNSRPTAAEELNGGRKYTEAMAEFAALEKKIDVTKETAAAIKTEKERIWKILNHPAPEMICCPECGQVLPSQEARR